MDCGGPAATAALAVLVPPGTTVTREADRERTDRYDRDLRYLYTGGRWSTSPWSPPSSTSNGGSSPA